MLLLLNLAWSLLVHPSYHSPAFDIVFPSHNALVSLFAAAGFLLLPDLELVLSGDRPSLSWFKSVGISIFERDQVPFKSWGIYLHVLIKSGSPPFYFTVARLHLQSLVFAPDLKTIAYNTLFLPKAWRKPAQ
ncbi:heat shock 70 (hsp70) [Fusarium heterosporum]|uniref:Heat shock 70 (Hsp70) n=1 Tax=Fusarium heterosporum TaxID=42747 RepID=A0A8H5WQ42_FUSHE|nr:heat shock 70 (hsp70) [Fusarium heterosporum]